MVPYGRVGRDFVHELAKFFLSYGEVGAFEAIAIKAAMLMCALLLQKPHSRTSGRDLASCLQRRLPLWNQSDIDALLNEGHTIQHRLLSHSGSHQKLDDDHHISRHFVECMLHGNVRSALNSITSEQSGVPLQLDSAVSPDNPSWLVLDELKKKHPVGRPASSAVLLPPPAHNSPFHPVIFDVLDGAAIRSAALRMRGAAALRDLMLMDGDVCVHPFRELPMTCVMVWYQLLGVSAPPMLTPLALPLWWLAG